jgi:imidazolonepropionase-like amidohydrolase
MKAIVSDYIIDGTGSDPRPGVIIVKGKRILAIGKKDDVTVPDEAEVIDATGKTVMPGLIDGHNSISGQFPGVRRLRHYLQRGVTTAAIFHGNKSDGKVMAGDLRDAVEAGYLRGCARLIVGYVVNCSHGHNKGRAADGPWEVRKAVREMIMAGADFIKTAASGGFWSPDENCSVRNYTPEELEALVDEAHAWGKPVGVHVHTQPGLNNAIRAKADIIYHGAFIDDEALEGIKRENLWYMPTLKVTSEPNLTAWTERPWMWAEMAESSPIHRRGVKKAHQMGIRIALGTDGPGAKPLWKDGETASFELTELVACGLSPMEAIVAGTKSVAEAYRKAADIGSLEPNKRADILVVDGDPLADISVLRDPENICLVMKDGSVEATTEEWKRYYKVRDF